MPSRTRFVALLLFGSGFCALIYQTTWLREFRLIFGASTAATAAVLGVFMTGLGFGGIILGRVTERKTRPLAFYAKLELFIAISAGLSPFLILAARQLYVVLGGTLTMGTIWGAIVRLILAALILGMPTFLMGGTLPAAVRAVVTPEDKSRRGVGVLYGVNTLGAVTGAVLGTFYLFENFGNHLALWWAMTVNAVVALTAFHLSRSMPDLKTDAKTVPELADEGSPTSPLFVFIAAGLVGFAFFLMEIVWYRMLGPLLGGSTFSFGLILATALLGIGFGGVTYAFFDLKRSASLRLFALTCAAEAFFIALPYALGDRIAITAMLLRPLGTLGFYGHVTAWTTLCFIVVFPAAFVSGMQFPLLVALLGKGRERVGSQTGVAYGWNTIGALIGSLAGGFGLLPLLSAPGVWELVVLLLGVLAIAACLPSVEPRRWLQVAIPLSLVALAFAMLATTGPTAFWRHSQIGVGRLKYYHASPNEMHDFINGIRCHIIWEADGIESGVALSNINSLSFIVNGKSDGNAKTDAGTQIMSGLIGAALHRNPEKAMVVGLGTGSTAGWLAAVPSMQRVDVVELERSVLKVAKECAAVNHNALASPKLHVIIGDGRELLLTIREKYDVVVSEPSNPYRAGVAGLFTREFYQSVDRRLAPGGIFLQWVQTYDVDDRTIEIFYRTLRSVFPNIESWQTEGGDLLLAASREPVRYDVEALRKRLAEDPFKSALRFAWRADGLEDFLAHYVGNNAVAKMMENVEDWPLNTDDRTLIEFAFARSVSASNGFQMANFRAAAHAAHGDRPQIAQDEIDWERVDEARLTMSPSSDLGEQRIDQRQRAAALASYENGDLINALRLWRAQPDQPKTIPERALVAECLANSGDNNALPYIDQLAAACPSDAEAIRAALFWKQGKKNEATESLKTFLRATHEDPWPDQPLIWRSIQLAETIAMSSWSKEASSSFYDLLQTPLSVWNGEAERMVRLLSIGIYLDGTSGGPHTASALHAFEPNVMWVRSFLETRRACYNAVRDPLAAQATDDLDDFMQHEALTSDVSALTKEIKINSGENARAVDSTQGSNRRRSPP